MKKAFIFFIALIFLLFLFFYFYQDIKFFTSIEMIKATHHKWVALYNEDPIKVIGYFILFNISMAMLPIPGISMISLLGGSIFGFIPGFLYSSFATAIGNLAAFFMARYFLYDYIYLRYGDKLKIFHESFQQEGIVALFSFRLLPIIPSFVANLVMGVTSLKWWSFFWVSWVGRIPMVLVYSWSGVQIYKINEAKEVLSLELISTFIFLASLPWVIRYLLKANKRFKAL